MYDTPSGEWHRLRILEIAAENGGVVPPARELGPLLHTHFTNANKHVRYLERDGRVVRNRQGRRVLATI